MFYLLAASLLWSVSFGLVGNLLSGLPAAWLALCRLTLAAAVFLPFARRVPLRTGAALMAVGVIQFGLMSLAYLTSFRYLKSHEVALFTVMTPVYVTLLNDLFKRSFRAANLGAALLAVLGAGVILWQGTETPAPLLGFALVEGANLCFALGQLAYREVAARSGAAFDDKRTFFWLYLGGLLALAPFGLRDMLLVAPRPTAAQLLAILYLGLLVSGLGYFLWNSGARRVPAGRLAVLNNLKIPLGVAVSLLVFGEKARLPGLLAGAVLIVAAFFVADLQRRQ